MTAASRLKVVDCRCAAMVFIGRLRRLSPYGVSFRLAASSSVPLTIPPRHFVALSRPGGKRVTGFSVVCRLPMNPVPLPPDKQGGAREYIGARHPPLKRVGKWRSGTVPFSSKTCCSLLAGSEDSDTLKLFPLRGTTACRLPLSHKQHKKLPEILCSRVAAGKFQEVFLFLFTAGC